MECGFYLSLYISFLQNSVFDTEPERRLRRTGKDVGAENDLLNNLGFNLCVVPWSPVVVLVVYFGVKGSRQRRGPKEVEIGME